MSLLDGFFSLGADENKVKDQTPNSGITDLLPELTLTLDDDALIALSKDWKNKWEPYSKKIEKIQKEIENYWMGNQFSVEGGDRGLVDNILFEALESFLPIATRAKPDPLVESDNTEEGVALADKVRKMLAYLADLISLNLEMKQVARYWAIYLLGAAKVGWSMKENNITLAAIRTPKLILDPEATIKGCRYTGYYIGEHVADMASDLVLRFPKKKDIIESKVQSKMGTNIPYIMWTTDEYIFWQLDDKVLGKAKNPHWNYETTTPATQSMDEFGVPVEIPGETIPGNNHFPAPRKPYIFLSIFNLGKQPHDDTNPIHQTLSLQDLVNKRLSQIDKNADNANGGIAVSGDAFTEEQASKVANTRRKGGTLWVPTGNVDAAVKDLPAQPLPSFIYESLVDYRNEIRNIFGTRGSTPQGTLAEETVGGKQIIRGQDADRIGGGVSTYLEQFADEVFNWFLQLMYVYYDEPHGATILGKDKAREYITLVSSELTGKLLVGVKDGSMIPHDPASDRQEAIELWKDSGIDPITFFEKLDFPNPREAAKNLYLWNADPIQLFPELVAQQQAQMAQQQAALAQEQQGIQEQQNAQVQADAEAQRSHELDKIQLQEAAKGANQPII